MRPSAIRKVLSANDTGETGGHQAGMLIPKDRGILSFFPLLDSKIKNPRVRLLVEDSDKGMWEFSFIYYNNRFFGGTRNEYRLTGMTAFIRMNNLKAGDTVILRRKDDIDLLIDFERALEKKLINNENILRLGSSWRVVQI